MASELVSYVHRTTEEQPKEESLVPAVVTEFVGQFFFVLTIQLVVGVNKDNPWGLFAIGAVLMCMIYMGGHISGAHYNPAVTFGVYLRGKIDRRKAIIYWATQVSSAILAAAVGYLLSGKHPAPGPNWDAGFNTGHAFIVEVIYTFALVLVVLNVATTKSQEDNMFFGLAIGFTVLCGALSAGNISGGVFNPAIGTGLLLIDGFCGGNIAHLWVYWLGPLTGSAMAAGVFRLSNKREFRTAPAGSDGNVRRISAKNADRQPLTDPNAYDA